MAITDYSGAIGIAPEWHLEAVDTGAARFALGAEIGGFFLIRGIA